MTGTYKNSIMLGIALPSKDDVSGQLQQLITNLNDTKINLDINIANSDVAKQLETLTSLADNFKSSLGGNISLGNVSEIINQATSAMESLNGDILKTTVKNFNDIYTVTQEVETGFGEVTKQVSKFQDLNGTLQQMGSTILTTTENLDKFESAMQEIEKAQSSLSNMKSNGFINAEQIESLKSQLDTIYNESNKENGIKFTSGNLSEVLEQVKQLENEEKNNIQLANQIQDAWDKTYQERLSAEQKTIEQIQNNEQKAYEQEILLLGQQALAEQKAEQDLINQMANGREKSQLKSQQNDRSQELSQAKSINQALEEQQQILQKQEEAYKQIDVLKSNGIVSESDITRLEQMVKSANSLKDMKNALNSIMSTSVMNESSIVSLSKQLDDAQIRLDKIKQTFGNKLPQGFIQSTESELNKLKEDLIKVDGMNFNGIKNGLNQVNTDMKVTTNETQQLVNSLKETNSGGFFTGISDFLAKAGLFYGVAQAVQEVTQQMKNAFDQAEKMDSAFTNMSITMNLTKEQFTSVAEKAQQMGESYGSSMNDVLQIAKTYSNAGSTIDEVMQKVKPDLWLSNVSKISSSDVTKTLQSVTNQFGLMTKEGMNAESATERIGNSLVAVSKNLNYDFESGIQQVTNAIKVGGSVAETSKMSMEEYMAMAGAFIQQTGLEGGQFANSLKMISARILKQKELGAELGLSSKDYSDAENALKRFDISTRDQGGNLRSLTDILKDTSVAFNKMSDSDKQYMANKLAGVNQSSKFIAIMQSMDTQQKLYNATQTDTNALYDAQQKHAESLEGRLGTLKATYEGLMNKMMNSETAKWLVTDATEFLNVLGQVDGKTIAFTATIGGLIVVMSKLATLNKTLIDGEAVNGLSKFIGLLAGMTTVEKEVVLSTGAMKVGLTGLEGAWVLLSTGIKEAIASSIAFMSTGIGLVITGVAVAVGVAISAFTAYKQHQAELEQQSKSLKEAIDGVNSSLKNGDVSGANAQLDETKEQQQQLEKLVETKKKLEGMSEDQFYGKIGGADKAQSIALVQHQIDELTNSLKQNGLTVDEDTGKIKELTEAQDKVSNAKIVDSIKEQTKSQLENRDNTEGAKQEYDNYIATVKSLYTEYQNLSAQENLSAEQKTRLGEVVAGLQDRFSNLNVKMDENGKVYISNEPLITDSIDYLQKEGVNIETLSGIRTQDAKITSSWQVGATQVTYGEIVKRIQLYKSEIKAIQEMLAVKAAADGKGTGWETINSDDSPELKSMKIASQGADLNSEYRNYDASNPEFEAKRAELEQLEKAQKLADETYSNISIPNAPSGGDTSSIDGSGGSGSGKSGADKSAEQAEKLGDEISKLKSNLDVDKFAEYNDAVKEVDNALTDNKTLREQYTENSPEYIKSEQQEIDLYKQKQQAVVALSMAQQQDASARKQKLADLGFEFDANGKLIDSDKKLLEMQDSVNAMGGDTEEAKQAKQDAINQLKDLQTQVKDYGTLVETTIPSTINQYNELANSIKKVNDQMNSSAISQLQKYEETLQKTEEQNVQNQYDKESKSVDNLMDKLEELHNTKLQNIEDEETALENEYNTDQEDETLAEKKTALETAQLALEKAQNQLSVKTYTQNADGSWGFSYKANQSNVNSAKDSYNSANKEYNDTVSQQEYNAKKKELEDEKTAETDNYNNSKTLLDNYKTYLSDTLTKQKEDISKYYEDTNKLATDELQKLVNLYGNDWSTIFSTIQSEYKKAESNYSTSKSSNTTTSDKVAKDKSKVSESLSNDNESEIDTATIKKALSSMGYDLEDYNSKTEKEIDTHNSTVETKQSTSNKSQETTQSKSYTTQLTNLKNFATEYLTISDKFLELLQVLYDFRFTALTTIAEASTALIVQGLVVAEDAYEKYQEIEKAMGVDTENISISDAQNELNSYKQTVAEYTSSKSSLYSSDSFEKFASQVSNSLSNVLTSSLTSTLSSSVTSAITNTTNNSSASNSTTVNLNGAISVNADNAEQLLSSVLKIATNKTNLITN